MPRSKLVTPSPCGAAIIGATSLEGGFSQPSRLPTLIINNEAMTNPRLRGDGRIIFCANSSFLSYGGNRGIAATVPYYPSRRRCNQPEDTAGKNEHWMRRIARRFGLESTLQARGRPKGS